MPGARLVTRASLAVALTLLAGASATEGQVIVSAYGGLVHTRPAGVRLEQPSRATDLTFPEVPFDSDSLRSPVYYGYRVALPLPGAARWYVEAELIHAKLYADARRAANGTGRVLGSGAQQVSFAETFDTFAMSHGFNFVLVNAVFRTPLARNGPWLWTARAGAGPMVPHPEIEIDGLTEEGYQVAGLGIQVSSGVERKLSRHLLIMADYKFTGGRTRVSVPGGTVRLTGRSHHLAAGVGVVFGDH